MVKEPWSYNENGLTYSRDATMTMTCGDSIPVGIFMGSITMTFARDESSQRCHYVLDIQTTFGAVYVKMFIGDIHTV